MRRTLVTAAALTASLACASVALGGTISGQVFRDYNSNGTKNAGGFVAGSSVAATDAAVSGVAVRAFDNAGNQVGEATTAADGTYSMSVGGSGTVRVEFATPSGFRSSFTGADSGTSVQFVDAAGASNVDYAVNVPGEYCQDNPQLVTCALPYLANYAVSSPGAAVLDSALGPLTMGERGEALGGTPSSPTALNSPSAMGAVWGLGTDRSGNAFFGTYVKRHSPYGPGSSGTNGNANWIYSVDIGTGTTAPWVRLGNATLPAHVAAAPAGWPDYSADGLRADNNPNDVFHSVGRAGLGDVDVTPDGSTLHAVEMTQADPRLWSVPITGPPDAPVPGTPSSVSIPRPTSASGVDCDGTWHPMGLGWADDALLVGGICQVEKPRQVPSITSSESVPGGSEGAPPGTSNLAITFSGAHDLAVGDLITLEAFARADSQCELTDPLGPRSPNWTPRINFFEVQGVANATTAVIDTGHWRCASLAANATTGTAALFAGRQLSAFVMRHDPSTQAFSTIAGVDLGYDKAMATEWYDVTALHKYDAWGLSFDWAYKKLGYWRTWNDWDPMPGDLSLNTSPQPMLANIETHPNGNLVLAFRDRWLDQTTAAAIDYDSSPGSPQQSRSYNAAADILVLCKSGSGYAKESNGACGTATGASMPRLLDGETDPAVRPNSPLYYWMGFVNSTTTGLAARHAYTGLGGVARMPGGPLWTTAYDITSLNQQGIRALGPCDPRTGNGSCGPAGVADGAILGGSAVSASFSTSSCGAGCWGKGNGLGDLELACDAAPLQIGNRIWVDANRNGIQDASEAPAAGVTVRLYDSAGTLAGTAVTDARGAYYFASNVTKPAAGDGGSTGGGLVADRAFTIKIDNAADFAPGGPLAGLSLTTADAMSSAPDANSAVINSKATLAGGVPTIEVAARRSGFNDHAFDAGFAPPPPEQGAGASGSSGTDGGAGSGVAVAMGDYAWFDANKDGKQGKAEKPLRGVRVTLLNAAGTQRARDRSGRLARIATTNKKGRYLISNLAPGEYRARFEIPAKYCFTKPGARGSKVNSNPVPTKLNRRIGLTPRFMIYGEVKGDTTTFSRTGVTANFANLTIDAGVASCGSPRTIVAG